jgi:chromosome segregation ATPase
MCDRMGIFDTWRRKKPEQPGAKIPVRRPETMLTEGARPATMSRPTAPGIVRLEARSPAAQTEVSGLVAEYERMVDRRKALQTERDELTARLDKGEITAQEWRKQLMASTQEAAQLSEKIRITSARLKWMGYTGLST